MTTSIISQIMNRQHFDTIDNLFKNEYREDPIKLDVNPLVLSVRLKKIREENTTQWFRLESPEVKARLMGDDFNEAEDIKDYYSKKLMWTSLKDTKLSDYRTHLMSHLAHPKTVLSRKEAGMIVSLPYFYAEDQVMDSIAKNYLVTDCPDVLPKPEPFDCELFDSYPSYLVQSFLTEQSQTNLK